MENLKVCMFKQRNKSACLLYSLLYGIKNNEKLRKELEEKEEIKELMKKEELLLESKLKYPKLQISDQKIILAVGLFTLYQIEKNFEKKIEHKRQKHKKKNCFFFQKLV